MSKGPTPGSPPPPGGNPTPPAGPPTGCSGDPGGSGGGDGCEGCCPSSPSGGPGNGAGTPVAGPSLSANTLDPENGNSGSCPTGGQPSFSASPQTALDRAFALANLGNRQWRQQTSTLEVVGAGCGGNVKVNLSSGNLIARWSPPSTGTNDPRPELVYNSSSTADTEFGYGWTNMLRQRVSLVSTTMTVAVIKGTDLATVYTTSGSGNYTPPNWGANALRTFQEGGQDVWLETQPDGFQLKYDASRKLAWMQNSQQARWTMGYDGSNRLQTVTAPTGQVTTLAYTTLTYNGLERLQSITDVAGRITSFSYSVDGDLTQITTPELCQLSLGYNTHLLTSVAAAGGQRVSYTYDGDERLAAVQWPNGGTTSYVYDNSNPFQPFTEVTDPLGRKTRLTGSSPQNLLVTNPLGERTTFVGSSDRMTKSVDALGNATTFVYSAAAAGTPRLLTLVELPLGGRFSYLYDTSQRLESVIDPNGNRATLVWDATVTYQRNALVDALGGRTTYSYNAAGQMTGITNPLSQTTTRVYDALGNLTVLVDPLGNRTTTTYNGANRPIATTNPSGFTTTLVRDQMNRVLATIDPLGNRTTNTYNNNGQLVAVSVPPGHTTTTVYDATTGQRAAIVDPLGFRTSFGYDLAGRQITVTDADSRTTTTVYDDADRVLATIDPEGNRTTLAYDRAGNQVSIMNPLGRVTTTVYDANGNVQAMVDALGNRTTHVYDPFDLRIATIDPLSYRTSYSFDALLRPVSVQDPLDQWQTTIYDGASRPVAGINPMGQRSTSTYDVAGRQTAVTNPLGYMTTFAYDASGRRIGVQDANGHRTTTSYDELGRPLASQSALGFVTTQTYDPTGRRIAERNARGNRTTFSYDTVGRQTEEQDPLGNRLTYLYDGAGQRTQRIDGRGLLTTYSYDGAGRLTRQLYRDNTRVTFVYDPVGNRTLMVDQFNGSTSFAYDALNRTTWTINPFGKAITYTYDARSQRAVLVDPDGGRLTYSYDRTGRLENLVNPQGWRTTFQYDPAGRRTGLVHGNGARASFSYDAADRLTTLENLKSDGTVLSRFDYSLDNVGNRTGCLLADGHRVTWTYDASYQLIREQRSGPFAYDTTYTYDGTGNRTLKIDSGARTTYTYDVADQLTALLDFALNLYVYDGNGNTVLVLDSIGGPIVTAAWDYEDRPVRIELMSQFGPITYTATYDGLHRRAWGQYGSPFGSIEAKLLWDEEKLLSTNDFFNDSTLALFTNEPGQYGPLVSTATQGEQFAYHFDGPGSTQQMTDGGQVVRADVVYKAFGEMLSNTGDAPNLFYYIGQWGYQTELPFWSYVRRRYLVSDFGRWLSRDPDDSPVDRWYTYCANSPLNLTDPTGRLAPTPCPTVWQTICITARGIGGTVITGCMQVLAAPLTFVTVVCTPTQCNRGAEIPQYRDCLLIGSGGCVGKQPNRTKRCTYDCGIDGQVDM